MKVYVEDGALREDLWKLQREGLIELLTFPYECRTGRPRARRRGRHRRPAKPSGVFWNELTHVTWDELQWPWEEFAPSCRFAGIAEIVGPDNRRDALHLDSAYKSGCKAFLSRDREHIVRNRAELEALLGLRVFHPDDDWGAFVEFVQLG